MNKKTKRFGINKFKESTFEVTERKQNFREERKVQEELPKVTFSLKDFDKTQIPPGQNFSDWEENKILSYLMGKFGHICEMNITEAQQNKYITIYGEFPKKSDFKKPTHIADNVKWAVIKKIKGQKGRVAGHVIDNVFYIVFLDKEHRFYIKEKD